MKFQRAAGVIVYSPARKKFLILKKPHFAFWEIPKGKLEPGEDDVTAMHRELKEETGITEFESTSFMMVTSYEFEREEKISKTLVVYLVYSDSDVTMSEEHEECAWVEYEEMYDKLHFSNMQEILAEAKKTIDQEEPSE